MGLITTIKGICNEKGEVRICDDIRLGVEKAEIFGEN